MYTVSKRLKVPPRSCPDYGGEKFKSKLASISKDAAGGNLSRETINSAASLVGHLGNIANAYRHIRRHGGPAAGMNGLSFQDLGYQEAADLILAVRDMIKSREYKGGPLKQVRIPKVGRAGYRTIWVHNLEDRIIQRAIAQVGNAYLDPTFLPTSFGFRPRIGRSHAAAYAIKHGLGQCEDVVCQDLKDAFDNANPRRALQVLHQRLPCKQFVDLAERSLTSGSKLGLRQGSPLSPLIVNAFLDKVLDQPWKQKFGHWPLLRYADDILVLTKTLPEAVQADQKLRQLLDPTGMVPKSPEKLSIVRLEAESELSWLGYGIRIKGDEARFLISEKSWDTLETGLEDLKAGVSNELEADQLVRGWVAELGPCYQNENHRDCFGRINELCQSNGCQLSMEFMDFERQWESAHKRFEAIEL